MSSQKSILYFALTLYMFTSAYEIFAKEPALLTQEEILQLRQFGSQVDANLKELQFLEREMRQLGETLHRAYNKHKLGPSFLTIPERPEPLIITLEYSK